MVLGADVVVLRHLVEKKKSNITGVEGTVLPYGYVTLTTLQIRF